MTSRCGIVLLAAALSSAIVHDAVRAQEPQRSVLDGVYSEAQANRGAAAYDTACSGCHRPDLSGGTGPALRQERFAQQYAGKDLKTLFTKIATTMPRNAAGSLPDSVNLDIVAHVLRENGFPTGPRELTAEATEGIRVVPGRPKPAPPVGDFSYVEVVGCLTAGPQQRWMLTHASEPIVALPSAPVSVAAMDTPLGTQTFQLLDALAYAPDDHKGQTVYIRGLLIKLAGEARITISTFETVSSTCRD